MIILFISEHGNQYFSIYQALGTEQMHVSVEPLGLLEPVFLFSLAKFRQLAFFSPKWLMIISVFLVSNGQILTTFFFFFLEKLKESSIGFYKHVRQNFEGCLIFFLLSYRQIQLNCLMDDDCRFSYITKIKNQIKSKGKM